MNNFSEVKIYGDEETDDLQNGLFIIQKKHGFKFGTDAVLLADFASEGSPERSAGRTLDLCTGSGIVPLLLYARNKNLRICGMELQSDVCDMARRSVELNGLTDSIEITEGNILDAPKIYGRSSFERITCNPPYTEAGTGLTNTTDAKKIARHEIFCTLDDVISVSAELLVSRSRFYMVHRPSRLADIMCSMRKHRLEPKRLRFVHPMPGKAPSLILVEGMRDGGRELKILPPLYICDEDGNPTEETNRIYNRG